MRRRKEMDTGKKDEEVKETKEEKKEEEVKEEISISSNEISCEQETELP